MSKKRPGQFFMSLLGGVWHGSLKSFYNSSWARTSEEMDGTLKIDHLQVRRTQKPLYINWDPSKHNALTLAHTIECVCFSLFLAPKNVEEIFCNFLVQMLQCFLKKLNLIFLPMKCWKTICSAVSVLLKTAQSAQVHLNCLEYSVCILLSIKQ